MALTMWYRRLFGDTNVFGVHIELVDDPHPALGMDPRIKASWGNIGIWARGRCLTRSCRTDGTTAESVTWYLLPLLQWLARGMVPLLNEEPFPERAADEVSSATDWYLASEDPPIPLTLDEEDRWFSRRSDWWRRHSLRSAFEGAAVPQILIRRLGGDIEIAWDNESWPASRPDLSFVEVRGSETVPAPTVADVVSNLCREVAVALAGREPSLQPLVEEVTVFRAGGDTWEWLIPSLTTDTIKHEGRFKGLVAALNERAGKAEGVLVEHSLETMLLRWAPPHAQVEDLESLLQLPSTPAVRSSSRTVLEAREPTPPPTRQPWEAGYEVATRFRHQVGWGDGKAPAIKRWLETEGGVRTSKARVGPLIDGAAIIKGDEAPLVHVNPAGQRRHSWSERMMWAAELGHILMEPGVGKDLAVVDSPWTYWPSAARARAFAAMLLMPENGVKEVLRQRGGANRESIQELMKKYETGLISTTWHLRNLRVISDDERMRLIEEVAGARA